MIIIILIIIMIIKMKIIISMMKRKITIKTEITRWKKIVKTKINKNKDNNSNH